MIITIAQAKIEDAPILAAAERTIAQEPGLLCSQPSELKDEAFVHTIQELSPGTTGIYLVAECNKHIVGHAFLKPLPLQSLCHVALLHIVVHHGWQNKGVGSQLLQKLIDWARQSPLKKIELNVRASNITAITLYKKMGFEEEGRLKNRVKVHDRYIDDIVMGLSLK